MVKSKCSFKSCHSRISVIGYCTWCSSKFCVSHRLTESHQCTGQQTLNEKLLEKLKLNCQEIKAAKIAKI